MSKASIRTQAALASRARTLVDFQTGCQSPLWPQDLTADLAVTGEHLAAGLARSAQAYPDSPALHYYGATTRYAELARDVDAFAAWLVATGLKAGDRVVIDLQNSPQFVIGFYGILRAGGVVVPVNPMNTAEELGWIVSDSGAHMVLAGNEVVGRFAELISQGALDTIVSVHYADRLAAQTTDPLPQVLTAPPIAGLPESATDFETAIAQGCDLPLPPMPAGGDALAILPYTSGTTGRPKACISTHSAASFAADAQRVWYRSAPHSVMTCFMPLFHVAGMIASMAHAITTGAALVLLTRWDADAVPTLLRRHKVTWWSAAPTMIVDVLESQNFSDDCFASVKVLTGGGASLPAAVAERLFARWGLRFCEGYGLTETISATHINALDNPKDQCLGLPIQNTHSILVDPDSLVPVAQGALGEVLISGPQIMQGYWNQPEATAQTLVELGGRVWLRTGDLGYVDSDGCFFIVDRIKRMINVSGYKVWPAECEMLLYRHPAVHEVSVISAPHPRSGEMVRAVIALKSEYRGKVDAADIIEFARGIMAAYKVPKDVEFRDALPRSGTRKIDWRSLWNEAWGKA